MNNEFICQLNKLHQKERLEKTIFDHHGTHPAIKRM